MRINNKMSMADVMLITNDFCELTDNREYEIVLRKLNLVDEEGLNKYATLFCCPKEDVKKAVKELDECNNKPKEGYKFNDKYCHIATYKTTSRYFEDISFDDKEESNIHANYSPNYKYIEDFFKSFIRFRNNLLRKNEVVKDDDAYQYFLSVVKGFDTKHRNKTKQKTK